MPISAVNAFFNAGVSNSKLQNKKVSSGKNSTENTSFSSNLVTSKNNKLPYAAGGVLFLAVAAYAIHKNFAGVKKYMKNIFQSTLSEDAKTALAKIKQVKNEQFSEVSRIINENSSNNIVRLDGMDAAALMRAADKTRPEHLHEAANMLEESYKIAYEKSKPEAGKNLFDKIFFRIDKESKAIVDIYAKMPKTDASVRLNSFAKEVEEINKTRKLSGAAGMKKQTFINKITQLVDAKRKS